MSGAPVQKQWGVTSPLSEALPSEAQKKQGEQLVEYLKSINNFETPEGNDRRERVLKHLQKVVEEFVKRIGKLKNYPQSLIDSLGGKIFTYGSYTIGVHGPDSDIDTLVVAPKYVAEKDYFDHFPDVFKELSDPALVTHFVAVPDAFVPIIKLEYDGVDIDLIFVSLPSQSAIPHDFDLLDETALRGLNNNTIRSVNGVRTAEELLRLVPQVQPFRHALRAIKVWANKRAVYGFVFGFPGGIAWALMVARLCQLYPYANGATVVQKFFSLMKQWIWPRAVVLKVLETESPLNLSIWNPEKNYGDKAHLMPVITPAYPMMCATHSVTPSTLAIMKAEFERGSTICNAIDAGHKSWADLFQRHTFFTKDHKYYLSVVASTTGTKGDFDAFTGLVQSKVRIMVKNIEFGNTGISQARIYTKGIERTHYCANEDEIDKVRQGSAKYQAAKDQTSNGTADGRTTVHSTTWYIGMELLGDTKTLDISYPVSEFKRLVVDDPDVFHPNDMAIKVVFMRNYDLPDDLFEKGETKPAKPTKSKKDDKKKKTSSEKDKDRKRKIAEAGIEDSEKSSKKRASEANGIPMSTPA